MGHLQHFNLKKLQLSKNTRVGGGGGEKGRRVGKNYFILKLQSSKLTINISFEATINIYGWTSSKMSLVQVKFNV